MLKRSDSPFVTLVNANSAVLVVATANALFVAFSQNFHGAFVHVNVCILYAKQLGQAHTGTKKHLDDQLIAHAGKITPNPGGVGPMTVAMLLQNTIRAAEQAAGSN